MTPFLRIPTDYEIWQRCEQRRAARANVRFVLGLLALAAVAITYFVR